MALLWQATAMADELPLAVESALNLRSVPHAAASFYVIDLQNGGTVLDIHGDVSRNPASTVKLLTTLVALDQLGPAYQWRTEVFARGSIEDGVLDGDLVLKGYGDPFLVTERVWQLLREIRHAGVRHIEGDLVIDDSWFDVTGYDPAAFDKQPLRAYNVVPNAMLMNFKVVRYWFQPNETGTGVEVRVDPPVSNLKVRNRLGIAERSCGGYRRGIAVSMNASLDEVTFDGRFPSRCKLYAMDRTALSHNEYVYGLFDSLWSASGGVLDGGWTTGTVGEDEEPLLSFPSLPLHDVISRVNKHSNNVMARQLVYTLAAEKLGPPGTEAGGTELIRDWLITSGLSGCCTAIENGAGLSREARISAQDMAAMLQFAWQQPYMPEYLSSMSLAGLDGTLRRRFDFNGLTGQAHLKTGSLDHVSALAGFLQSREGRRYAVVSMLNHTDVHRGPGDEVHEALLRWLYEYRAPGL